MIVGVLGGTFDPIHLGHLVVAEEVRRRLGLEEVWFVPTGQPWLKVDRGISSAEHRVKMVSLAIASNRYFKLSKIEIERPGPSYSVDTIAALRSQWRLAEIFFILGRDALMDLPLWKEPGRLIELCQLVAVDRPGSSLPDLRSLELAIPHLASRVLFVEVPQLDISSSQVRDRVAQGLSIKYLVPEGVEEYIREEGLYLSKASKEPS